MKLIIETDLGHDPDDFFAICYLIAADVDIQCINICPGGPDQVALAAMIRKRTGKDFLIGVSHQNRNDVGTGNFHKDLLKHFGRVENANGLPDGTGVDCIQSSVQQLLLRDTHGRVQGLEALVIGPPKSIGQYLMRPKPYHFISRITVQGGFLAYHHHNFPCLRLEKFDDKSWCPTFNLNGDRTGAMAIAESKVPKIQYVCKNVCHTVEYDRDRFVESIRTPESAAEELFQKAGEIYFDRHAEKKFHDPTAAVCHLHPEIASWVKGYMTKIEGGWGGIPDPGGHDIIADIDYDALWGHIERFD